MKTVEFVSSLLSARTDMHVAHLQASKHSIHIILQEFYEDVEDLADRFIESYQGKYGLLKGYSISFSEGLDPLKYLQNLSEEYTEHRLTYKDGYLQAIVDDILELINTTCYKLKFLSH